MKRKFISVVLALLLVLSFSLVTTVPAEAVGETVVQLRHTGEPGTAGSRGTAEWTTEQAHIGGSSSVKLTLPTAFNDSDEAFVRIPLIERNINFADFSCSYWFYVDSSTVMTSTPIYHRKGLEGVGENPQIPPSEPQADAYWGPYLIIELDINGDGVFTHQDEPGNRVDGKIIQWQGKIAPSDGIYDADKWCEDVVDDTPEAFWCTNPFLFEWQTFSHFKELYGSLKVLAVRIMVGQQNAGGGTVTCYVDDVTVNGVTYSLELPTARPLTVDDDRVENPDAYFQRIQSAIDCGVAGDTITVAAGTYEENVVLDKEGLTLKSVVEHGAAVRGQGIAAKPTVAVMADGVRLDGFTVYSDPHKDSAFTIDVAGNDAVLVNLSVVKESRYWNGTERRDGAAVRLYPGTDGFTFTDSVVNSAWNGVYAQHSPGSSNVTIRNVEFRYPGEYGVILMGTNGAAIEGNTFECQADTSSSYGVIVTGEAAHVDIIDNELLGSDSAYMGILLQKFSASVPTLGTVNILGNDISGWTTGLLLQAGLELIAEADITVEDNKFSDNGVQVKDEAEILNIDDVLANNDFDRAVVVRGSDIKVPIIFSSIQDAIDAAEAGDTISVAAGTYTAGGLVADIYKSNLTLKSTDGPEVTVIQSAGEEGDGAIRIRGTDGETPTTDVTVDGFTVYNTGTANKGLGILIGADFVGRMTLPANGNTVKNCIIGSDTDQSLSPTFGVYLWNTTGNIIQNNIIYKVRNEPEPDFGVGIIAWGGLVDQEAPSPNNQIIDNKIYDSDRHGIFIGAATLQNFDNIIIERNSITRSGARGIGMWNVGGSDSIHINSNNIYDNAGGGISASGGDAAVDATNNWWGHVSGPKDPAAYEATGYQAYGDKVSGNVYYNPWLLEEVDPEVTPTTYDKTLALKDGWTLVSVDKEVTVNTIWEGTNEVSPGKTILAYRYIDHETGFPQVNEATDLTSVDAFYVKTIGGGGVGIIYSDAQPGVVTKSLKEGWNLISAAGETDAYTLLRPLRHVQIGQQQGVGLTNVVGQGSYNQFTGTISLTAEELPWEGAAIWALMGNWEGEQVFLFPFEEDTHDVSPFDGYWVYMNAAKIFGVIPD